MISLSKLEVGMDGTRNRFLSIKSLCLVLFALFVMNSSYSQAETKPSGLHVNAGMSYQLAYNGVTLEYVLGELQKTTSRHIIYSSEDVNPYKEVSVHCNSNDMEEVMGEVLKETKLGYEINSQQVLIFKETPKVTTSKSRLNTTQSDEVVIKGSVKDAKGNPIPGASVTTADESKGVITDFDGNYTFRVSKDDILHFSYVGYKPQTVPQEGRSLINIILQEDLMGLDEVVIVAYGVQKKSDLTGAVSSVSLDDVQKVAVSTPAESLQGRVSGVSVSRSSGAPGDSVNVRIRGVASFGNNKPLYIIDGVEGDINNVNPDDIASMEVLKDASSAAIYGSRAANGVVIITTKDGEAGKIKVNFTAYAGPQEVAKTLPLMTNSADWMKVNKAAYVNAGNSLPQWHQDDITDFANTDWQDEMYRRGLMQNYNLNFSGGHKDLNFMFSMGYFDQEGVVRDTDFEKLTARLKLNFTKGILKVVPNISITQSTSNDFNTSIYTINRITPMIPVYDKERMNGYGYSSYGGLAENNPVGLQEVIDAASKNTDINTNLMASLDLAKGLVLKMNTGYRNNFYNYKKHYPAYRLNVKEGAEFPYNEESTTYYSQLLLELMASYHYELDKHSFDVLGGVSRQKQFSRNHGVSVEGKDSNNDPIGFPNQNFDVISAGSGGTFSGWGTESTFTRASIFGRLNYNYDSKYLFQATIRRDGTSRFNEDERYGVFPSVSTGWNVHKESFFAPISDVVNNFKLRASWGKLGSDVNLQNYYYQGLMNVGKPYVFGGSLINGIYTNGLPVDKYVWEESEDWNVGFDFGLLKNLVYGSVNYFVSTRRDILVDQPLPVSSGLSSQKKNFGEIRNKGWEFELGARSSVGDFKWDVKATLSTVSNEVLQLGDGVNLQKGPDIGGKMPVVWTEVGESIGQFHTFKVDRLFQNESEIAQSAQKSAKPGDIKYVEAKEDKSLTYDDLHNTGSALPDFEYGLSVNMSYKGFDFNAFFNGREGNKIFNVARYYGENMLGNFNYWTTTLDHWTPTNRDTSMPRPNINDWSNSLISDRFIEDGSYFRLKSIQLGYTFNNEWLKKIKMDKLRVYVSGQNLFTITDYTGYDPEMVSQNVWNMGIDYGVYPSSKTYLLGLQVSF
ncbi:TonB-dependent receptor [Halosquirtibacter xylanolyticus]|uniref:TonB-dependent receptor n=1 Tax=Halosquirtibacter xylanolyticus TaxID=3374599 RepID=UPI0037484C55|nr:TonB-dependent receptor [Prolixibacteraceae bacterium]